MNTTIDESKLSSEISTFQRDGVVRIPDAFDKEWIERLRSAIDQLILTQQAKANNNTRFITISNVWKEQPDFRDLCFHSPLGQIGAALLSSPKVWLYEDTLMVKLPGAKEITPWHQDSPYYPLHTKDICTLWLALDHVTFHNGGVCFIRGSHTWDRSFRQPVSFHSDKGWYHEHLPPLPEFDLEDPELIRFELQPGDCTVHHGLIIHGAPANQSITQSRRAIAISIFANPTDADTELQKYPEIWSLR